MKQRLALWVLGAIILFECVQLGIGVWLGVSVGLTFAQQQGWW